MRERLDDRGRVLALILNLEAFGQFLRQTIWIYFPAQRDSSESFSKMVLV